MSLIQLTKIPREGIPYVVAINMANIIEIAPKDDSSSWLKYWDGKEVRSACIVESPEQVAATYR